MNILSPTAIIAFLCLFFATSTPSLLAAEKKIPFHGKIAAVDTAAQTITVGKKQRVFHVVATTKVKDGSGNPTTLAAATVGEDCGGSYDKATMDLYSLRIGAKAGSKSAKADDSDDSDAAAPAAAAPMAASAPAAMTPPAAPMAAPKSPATAGKKSRFSGKIASVDASGGSLVIHGETLLVNGSSKITDATGASIGLSDLAVGDKISGSALKAADGTMTVVTLKKAK